MNDKYFRSSLKKQPKFNDEEEEREFWGAADSTEYIDWKKSEKVAFSKLKPLTKTIGRSLS